MPIGKAWDWLSERAAEEIIDPKTFAMLGHVLRAIADIGGNDFLTAPNRGGNVPVVISRRLELVAAVASFSAGGHPMSRLTRNGMAFSVRVGRSA